jgi:hypothetical protein
MVMVVSVLLKLMDVEKMVDRMGRADDVHAMVRPAG